MRDTQREAETQAEGEAGSLQGAPCGTRSQVSRIAPWAKGRRETAAPPRDPSFLFLFKILFICSRETERERSRDIGRERSRLPAGSLMRDSIPGPQDHDLIQRQTLNC